MLLAISFSSVLASPAAEIDRAVKAGGSMNATIAGPRAFVNAYLAVIARVPVRDIPTYAAAAVKLRPDLAKQILAASARTACLGKRQDCDKELTRIVSAMIAASPESAGTIVAAAVQLSPGARQAIITAAIAAAPKQELAILRAAGDLQTTAFLDPFWFGSINPKNQAGAEPVVSQEQPPSGP